MLHGEAVGTTGTAPSPARAKRLALVGSGAALLRALEGLRETPLVVVAVVADVGGATEASALARSLGISLVSNPLDVFRMSVDIVLELNGEARQYERLLAVKPPEVEVMSAHGARLLVALLRQSRGDATPSAEEPTALVVVAGFQSKLFDYLGEAFRGIRDVRVITDRRLGERRDRVRGIGVERRVAGRRLQPSLDAELMSRGFAVVRQTPHALAG